jgi:hypothetical protein
MFDQALHLVTNYKAIQTARQNLNFIFSDRESHESQWMHLYTRLPLLLAYAVDLSTVLVGGILEVPMPQSRGGNASPADRTRSMERRLRVSEDRKNDGQDGANASFAHWTSDARIVIVSSEISAAWMSYT